MVLACVLFAWYLWDRKLYFKQLYKSVKSNTLSSCLASDGNPNRLTSSVLFNHLTSSMLLNRLTNSMLLNRLTRSMLLNRLKTDKWFQK